MASVKKIARELWKAEEELINVIAVETKLRLRIFELRKKLAATPLYPEEEEEHHIRLKRPPSALLSEEHSQVERSSFPLHLHSQESRAHRLALKPTVPPRPLADPE